MPQISEPHYLEGFDAYQVGKSVMTLAERADQANKESPDGAGSLIVGFIDGLVADVRKLAAMSRL